jgi:carbamoyl-phosphate synthase small subunit
MPSLAPSPRPASATAALLLSDGSVFWGKALGKKATFAAELCFNTGLTGYQEVMTDPSYAGQTITFTFPHIGNVGTNDEDIECLTAYARGAVLAADITLPSSWREQQHFNDWLISQGLPAICGVDTREITRKLRDGGALGCVILHQEADGSIDLAAGMAVLEAWGGLEGADLAADVSCTQSYAWDETLWDLEKGYGRMEAPQRHVVAVDFGAKRNILRCLANEGCKVTVVPANTSAEAILALQPDGVFLSNGPGDPAATGVYAEPMIKGVLASGTPLFGICLGHQLLARALGAQTKKMHMGHRGANHPVKDLTTGKVEITSQNHGFAVDAASLPAGVSETHISLFDKTNEGLAVEGKPVFSVQYHPEASPGPQDSHYLFKRFVDLIDQARA